MLRAECLRKCIAGSTPEWCASIFQAKAPRLSAMAPRTLANLLPSARTNWSGAWRISVGLSQPQHEIERDPSQLSSYVPPFNGTPAGSFFSDPVLHGGFVRPITEEQREEWGTEGAEYIRSQVASFDVKGMLEELRKRDEYTRVLEERYGDLLPRFDR
ncbi:hypothetical protein [Aurantiacibacter suaedae]|uniref:hypothetical protein n=1 Tax=Aurantiacibacter suaedae TaxID=2545755 RepID=UPI0010F59FB3|nr:hypothetical protein [Aurantiacibacter suaedae]